MSIESRVNELEGRIIELESREGFHEHTIEILNEALIEQAKQIDLLTRAHQLLLEKLKNLPAEEGTQYSAVDEKPPHY